MRLCEEPQSMGGGQFGSQGPSDGVGWWGADRGEWAALCFGLELESQLSVPR